METSAKLRGAFLAVVAAAIILPASVRASEKPKIDALSREVGSSAGGVTVTVTGRNFEPGASVVFGGISSNSVTFHSPTRLTAVVPAHVVGLVDVEVRNPSGKVGTLRHGFDYEPAPTAVYFQHDFEDGTLGSLHPDYAGGCFPATVSSEASHSGTKSAKMGGACYTSRLEYRWCNDKVRDLAQPCNPALSEANGLWQRFFIMMPQATIDRVVTGNQLKLLLNRYNVDNPVCCGWFQIGFGRAFGEPWDYLRVKSDGEPAWGGWTGLHLRGGVWVEFETNYKLDPVTRRAHARLWVNGKLQMDELVSGLGNADPAMQQALYVGMVTFEGSGPLVVYVDDVAAANGFIDPPPAVSLSATLAPR